MGRVLAIASFSIGVCAVGAFFWSTVDEPCEPSRVGPVALFIGALLFGVTAYLLAYRSSSRSWLPITALLITAVGGYFAFQVIVLLAF